MNGKVKWFDDAKGFGFIEADGITGDVFAHQSKIEMPGRRTLTEGQQVTFEIVQGPKGHCAEHIVPA